VDHVFWELRHNPWVVKNLLDNFQRYYSYTDQVKDRKTGGLGPGGISFTHDMGVHNNFSPFGHSSYELANLDAECFSYMTAEQLCNWTLIAACYVANTGDVEWARHNQPVLDACLASLINRGPQTGIIERDSARCGSGAEITTYDSLDHSLAQTRNNVYMAVKAWASYAALLRIDVAVGRDDPARRATIERMMSLTERTLGAQVQPDGHLPAVFEKDNSGFASRILPACEGLVYLWFWGERDRLAEGSPLQQMLKAHTLSLLLDREKRNLFNDGGLKLSSTSNNSWISKIAIVQHVARRVFGLGGDPGITAIFRQADAAHVKWETEGASAYWAMSDQIVSGVAQGSRYYPRCVTSVLWLAR
jgi:hypothetical protein